MATLTFTTDFDWPTLLKKEPSISIGPSNYFNDVHHKDYEIDRTKRRLALTESFYEWFNTGRAFAIVRDNKDAQFARTLSVFKTYKDGMWTEKRVHSSYPMYQSLLNVVKREGLLCQCNDEKNPCKLVGIFWRLEIPNLIVLYRHGTYNPWEYVDMKYAKDEIVWEKITKNIFCETAYHSACDGKGLNDGKEIPCTCYCHQKPVALSS